MYVSRSSFLVWGKLLLNDQHASCMQALAIHDMCAMANEVECALQLLIASRVGGRERSVDGCMGMRARVYFFILYRFYSGEAIALWLLYTYAGCCYLLMLAHS